MELDACAAANGITLTADLCIVGAGPVGQAITHALRNSGLTVAVIESGSAEPTADTDALNDGNGVGDVGTELRLARSRSIGGTAAIWNTMLAGAVGAKYLPLDSIDFEAKAWAQSDGWQLAHSSLDRFYRDAHEICGLGAFDYRPATWSDDRHQLLDLRGSELEHGVYQYGRADAFRVTLPALLSKSTCVTLVRGATVTGFRRTTGSGRIVDAEWVTLSGNRGSVRADRFVLALGGIENARMLLLDRRGRGGPLPSSDWIGRGFMDHPIDGSVALISRDPAFREPDSFFLPHAVAGAPGVVGRIALPGELLRELQVPNASVRLGSTSDIPMLRATASRSTARRLVPFQPLRRAVGNTIRRVAAARDQLRGHRYPLLIDLEQLLHRDNRVVLSTSCDRFGLPRPELHWRWRAEDDARRCRVRDAVVRQLLGARLGRIEVDADRPVDPDGHHHIGSTRMHAEPGEGVVDLNLRVHGEENLYVAGSSVFPAAGFANPTLTAIALGLRLADHLITS